MFILQTLKDFIDNPMGRGSNAITSRQLIKDDLKRRLDVLLRDKKITQTIYKKNEEYYFHFLIPSEDLKRNNTYDVILHFIPDIDTKGDKDLRRYLVKLFSNSPGFTFTYAYAFNLYGILVEELDQKFGSEVIGNPPVVRNPAEVIGYEKTTFFACTYLINNDKYLAKSTIDLLAKKYNETDFAKSIRNIDVIEIQIKTEKARVTAEEVKSASKDKGTHPRKQDDRKHNAMTKSVAHRGSTDRSTEVEMFKDKGKIGARKSSRPKIRSK